MRIKGTVAINLTLVVLLIFVIGQGAVWVWSLFGIKEFSADMLRSKVSASASNLSNSAGYAVANNNLDVLDSIVEQTGKNGDILSIKIFDVNESLLLKQEFASEESSSSVNPLYVPWQERLTVPIEEGGVRVGLAELVYSGRRVNEMMFGQLTTGPVVEGLVLIVLMICIFLYLTQRVGKPLSMLKYRIGKVTKGDLTVTIPKFADNEIGYIADGLRYLVKTLLGNISQINATAEKAAQAADELGTIIREVTESTSMMADSTSDIVESTRKASDSQRSIADATDSLSKFSTDNVSFLLEVKSTSDEIVSSAIKLFTTAEDSYSIMEEMSQTARVMAENSGEVRQSVEDTMASLEEIRASVQEVEGSAKESSKIASGVKEKAALDGTLLVADAIETSEGTADKVGKAVDRVKKLEKKSVDVQKMLSVIKEVTEQTNLLSLNAAILAEQAGEFGKGFSVVADEMRSLSDRTAASTKDIASIIRSVQEDIRDVVKSIEEGMVMVQKGTKMVYKVGESMGSILESAGTSAKMTAAIEKATEEQVRAIDLVTNSMGTVTNMASKMNTATNEQMKASSYMLERVGEVREVAELTKRSTEEQAKGTTMMSKNIEQANDKIFGINSATIDQRNVYDSIVSAVENISSFGKKTVGHVEGMNDALEKLTREIDALKREMGDFRIS